MPKQTPANRIQPEMCDARKYSNTRVKISKSITTKVAFPQTSRPREQLIDSSRSIALSLPRLPSLASIAKGSRENDRRGALIALLVVFPYYLRFALGRSLRASRLLRARG